MKRLILMAVSLFTFLGASQKMLVSSFGDGKYEEKKVFIYDMKKPLLYGDFKKKEIIKEFKTLSRRQDEEFIYQYVCSLNPSLWIKEDITILQGQKEVVIRNVPAGYSSFRYHAV